jgi:hypothetical protein
VLKRFIASSLIVLVSACSLSAVLCGCKGGETPENMTAETQAPDSADTPSPDGLSGTVYDFDDTEEPPCLADISGFENGKWATPWKM